MRESEKEKEILEKQKTLETELVTQIQTQKQFQEQFQEQTDELQEQLQIAIRGQKTAEEKYEKLLNHCDMLEAHVENV